MSRIKQIWHPWWLWEDYPAGFYESAPKKMSIDEGIEVYRQFLGDLAEFETGLRRILREWPRSCEHNLSNDKMNRIAYLGQASVCIEMGVPSCCRVGFSRLSEYEQQEANDLALHYLNRWLIKRGESEVSLENGLKETVRAE